MNAETRRTVSVPLLQFMLRDELYNTNTGNLLLGKLGQDVENPVGKKLYAYDLRKAIVKAGLENEDAIIEALLEQGYERTE